MSEPEPFGFRVEQERVRMARPGVVGPGTDQWTVYLPHQCDEWTITAENAYRGPVPHDEAVDRLTRFITEATEALWFLKQRKEFGE